MAAGGEAKARAGGRRPLALALATTFAAIGALAWACRGPAPQPDAALAPDPTAPERCPLGTAGCRCDLAQCDEGLVCYRFHCYGGDVAAPDTYYYTPRAEADTLALRPLLLDLVKVAPGDHVVDLGAGHGWFSFRLADQIGVGGVVWATDLDPGIVTTLRAKAADHARAHPDAGAVRPLQCQHGRDAAVATVPDATVAWLLAINSATFSPAAGEQAADLAYLREFLRVLRPGGRFLFHTDWIQEGMRDRDGAIALFRAAGFAPEVEEVPMPAQIPEASYYLDRPGGRRIALRRGYILIFRKPKG
jgi:SAM-dependent methyltransferase